MERILVVGVAGFEPAASCSQSRRDNRATLHPEKKFLKKRMFLFEGANIGFKFFFANEKANKIVLLDNY